MLFFFFTMITIIYIYIKTGLHFHICGNRRTTSYLKRARSFHVKAVSYERINEWCVEMSEIGLALACVWEKIEEMGRVNERGRLGENDDDEISTPKNTT